MKKLLLSLMFVAFVLSANASLKQNRLDARFMTDRMAYELNFSADQFQDVYEVNLDFIYKVSFIIDNIVMGYNDAIDRYYEILDERNADLSYILNSVQYRNFLNRDYFYRPIYANYRGWYYRINHVYPNRNFYYYSMPGNYYYSIGSHYNRNYYNGRYNQERYNGEYSVHRYGDYGVQRRSDFGNNTRDRGQGRPNNYNNTYSNNRTNDPRYSHKYNNDNVNVVNDIFDAIFGHGKRNNNNNNNNNGIGNGASVNNNGIGNGASVNSGNGRNTGYNNNGSNSNNNGIGSGATVGGNTGIGSGATVGGNSGIGSGASAGGIGSGANVGGVGRAMDQ